MYLTQVTLKININNKNFYNFIHHHVNDTNAMVTTSDTNAMVTKFLVQLEVWEQNFPKKKRYPYLK